MDNNQIISADLATGNDHTVLVEVKNGKVQTIYADPDIYAAVIKDMEANGMFDNNAKNGDEWDVITAAIEQINTSPFPYLNKPDNNA